ncbi:pentatricopeptide repeat-containing protein At4g39530 [Selaginella moellendorffii]|uniref:pentatricopeptide repeat-containing protein At4g39530 n=1 Tax=Selaginella moellendorffii TaxID=88036 RepID=UPI000D1CD7F4|nr:pentatricopeptide repeat-containing protein At4g39530 [Selaginella moellendorffii]|eukprot:XP_024519384.1 pentatricopeptide repeat-containing protein At4g39530 [Selaginella moellendorffii]
MERKSLVAWNTMIAACAQRGLAAEAQELFKAMDVEPDGFTFASLLAVCCDLDLGRRLHAGIATARLASRLIVDTALVGMYSRCGSLGDAAAVFEGMEDRDTVAWNAMIAAFAEARDLDRAMECYQRMLDRSTCEPNGITYATLLAACRDRGDLGHGRRLFKDAQDRGLYPDRFVQSAAVAMLARCGAICEARKLLREGKIRDVEAWNAMISAYAQMGHLREALGIYREMEHDGSSSPDLFTFASALAAAAGLGDLDTGKAIHERMAAERSLKLDVFAANALLTMFSKCGSLGDAKLVFDRIPDKDAVSWNSMISAYAHHGRYKDAIATYRAMDCRPDEATIVSALAAASALADLDEGAAIHARALELGIATPAVESTLASMHAKCGSLDAAMALFEKNREKDLVSWNAMVAAYAQHGDGSEALALIHRMELEGISPNGVTLSGVLASCSHAGLLERGMFYVGWLSREHGVAVESEHYRFVVELLGRCGRLGEAEAVVRGMPLEPEPALWVTLVAACVLHEEVSRADRAAAGLDPGDAASYVLLANVYSAGI